MSYSMQYVVANLSGGKVRRETLGGKKYLVAPVSMIVPGVLNGSEGPLFYPPDEIAKNTNDWNNIPIVVYHPASKGNHGTAKDPEVLDKQGIGMILRANVSRRNGSTGKLRAEGWFDEQRTKAVDRRVYAALLKGQPMEVSTGLYTRNTPAKNGANHNGKVYTRIARDYRPDHLAILPDQTGACSLKDGCGLNVNSFCPTGSGGGVDPSCGKGESGGAPKGEAEAKARFPHMAHLLNGQKIHSEGLKKSEAKKEALSLRSRGVFAGVFKDEKTKTFMVTIPSNTPSMNRRRIQRALNAITKKEGSENLPSSAYAYVPDSESPSTWKLRIDDAQHLGGAIAALHGKGFRGQRVEIPRADLPAVKKRIRAAWLKLHKGKTEKDLPSILTNRRRPNMARKLKPEARQAIITNLLACKDCGWNKEDKDLLEGLPDEKLADLAKAQEGMKTMAKKTADQEAVTNAALKGFNEIYGDKVKDLTLNEMPAAIKKAMAKEGDCAEGDQECLDAAEKAKATKNKETSEGEKMKLTENQLLDAMSPEMKEDLAFARREKAKQKTELVKRLTANVEDEAQKAAIAKRLGEKGLDELQELLALLPQEKSGSADPVSQNYTGAVGAGTVVNRLNDDERTPGLSLPVLNFEDTRHKKTG